MCAAGGGGSRTLWVLRRPPFRVHAHTPPVSRPASCERYLVCHRVAGPVPPAVLHALRAVNGSLGAKPSIPPTDAADAVEPHRSPTPPSHSTHYVYLPGPGDHVLPPHELAASPSFVQWLVDTNAALCERQIAACQDIVMAASYGW